MLNNLLAAMVIAFGLCLTVVGMNPRSGAQFSGSLAVQTPVLKWQKGGCYSSWCETGWYSSPAVADLDGDGQVEVIGSAYSIVSLNGSTGALKWRVNSGHELGSPGAGNVGRTWPGVVVADIDGNGQLEVVTAHGSGYVSAYDRFGYFLPGWPKNPSAEEFRSLAVADLDGNGKVEILVASTRSAYQWYVYQPDGSVRPSQWPQHYPDSSTNGYAAGAYNQNIGVGDLDGDGKGEIIGPSDVHYITAYRENGVQYQANAVFGQNPDGSNKFWSRVGVHVDPAVDLRGYANCGVEHRPNFANSAPTIADLNGDGMLEIIVVGNVHNCGTDPYTDLYEVPFIFNGDRTRWAAGGFDWNTIPIPDGQSAPLSEDYNLIENSLPNPVVADLDGDGKKEILYPSYDGRLHAYWLDKTEHGSWPYTVYNPAEGFFRFASEPVVADLDNDGRAEVIFADWPAKGSNRLGRLHILNYLGQDLQSIPLPAPFSGDWNGGLAAPTLADIDGDHELEVVLNTAHSGLVAYDLPGTSQARVLWGTGRGNYQRTGGLLLGSVEPSTMTVNGTRAVAGQILTYTITLRNPGPDLPTVHLTNALPSELLYAGSLAASSGSASQSGGVVNWTGSVPAGSPITIVYNAQVRPDLFAPRLIGNTATIDDGQGNIFSKTAAVIANGKAVFLPIVSRN